MLERRRYQDGVIDPNQEIDQRVADLVSDGVGHCLCNLGGAPVPHSHPSHPKSAIAAAESKKISGGRGNGELKEKCGIVEFGDVGVCHHGIDDPLVGGEGAGRERYMFGASIELVSRKDKTEFSWVLLRHWESRGEDARSEALSWKRFSKMRP